MNLKYWDKHKAATVITAVAVIIAFALVNITSSFDEKAFEIAAEKISISEAEAILKYYDFYEQELPATYHPLNSLSTIAWYIILFGALYSAWSALDIPERYRKEEKVKVNQNDF